MYLEYELEDDGSYYILDQLNSYSFDKLEFMCTMLELTAEGFEECVAILKEVRTYFNNL